jgi:hypothetical protein
MEAVANPLGCRFLPPELTAPQKPPIVPLQAHGDKSPAMWNASGATTFITYGNFEYTGPRCPGRSACEQKVKTLTLAQLSGSHGVGAAIRRTNVRFITA